MHRDDETKPRTPRAVALAAAYLLGVGTALLALGGLSAGRGWVAAGAAALILALAVAVAPRLARRGAAPSAVAWAGAPAIGQELPTVNDYYSNSPDGTPPPAMSHSPYRCWEPLPPEGGAPGA